MNASNQRIRQAAKTSSVYLWQIAEKLGLNDGNFSRKLRHELPAEEQEKILGIIAQIAAERG